MEELTMQEMLDLQDQEMKKIQIGATITGKVTSIDNAVSYTHLTLPTT